MKSHVAIVSLLALGLAACSQDKAVETAESMGASVSPAELTKQSLQIAAMQDGLCAWDDREIGELFFPGKDASVSSKTRGKSCFYTINGGRGEDQDFDIARVVVISHGFDSSRHEEFAKLYEQQAAEGFPAPTYLSALRKKGEAYGYAAYPLLGSVEVLVKWDDTSAEKADKLARILTINLIERLQ